MKILIVEDDPDYAKYITRDVQKINAHSEFVYATSRDEAMAKLAPGNYYDLIVLDLSIPTLEGALDALPVHGNSVFATAMSTTPGTPVFVLTGSPAAPFVGQLTANVNQKRIWGGDTLPTIEFLEKYNYGDSFPEKIAPYLKNFDAIFDIELDKGKCILSGREHRLIRVFAKQCNAARCAVTQLSGGLSGVKVFRLKLTDHRGVLLHDAVCKLGARQDVFDESDRVDKHISRLNQEATPRKLALLDTGAADLCGIFYHLAEGFGSHAFEVAIKNDADACRCLIRHLQKITLPWVNGVPQSTVELKTLREHAISDEKFLPIRAGLEVPWIEDFEKRRIQVVHGCGHGDLHGFNVLVRENFQGILIDYGDVGPCASALDPITLELSLFFHPDGPLRESVWPSIAESLEWGNLDEYLKGCPVPVFIQECRRWATEVTAGKREVAGVAYSYLVRQLKYEKVNKERVLALMAGAKKLFDTDT